ncbi:MAG: arginine--tRNA ligase [SAR202 cluster bacterium]|nr:arginine--tRNA ligase [SAR202 cluster bacterium]|tara:strand:+ start:14023 stop:15684 length:1662 start_codon:yes stop_codon:yes gene_type:complete
MNARTTISHVLKSATISIKEDINLPLDTPVDILLEVPQNPDHGDFATSLALRLAKPCNMSPQNIADRIIAASKPSEAIESIWVEGPGFINVSLNKIWVSHQVENINSIGQKYGNIELGNKSRVQVEYVSVNPTGPVHVGHARGAVLGDTLSNILETANFNVTREYYFNDAGAQMELFYKSLHARYLQINGQSVEMPDNGYMGEYMIDLAKELINDILEQSDNVSVEYTPEEIGQLGLNKMLENIRSDLDSLNISFDVWFKEHTLYDLGQYSEAMKLLKQGGFIAQEDGATWFKSSLLGEEKDNVVVRSNGTPTYFAADIAYHYNKFVERQFATVIDVWGADHQGHVSRMKAAVKAIGVDPENLTIIITQIVTLKRGNQQIRASKRTGDVITLQELIDEVGPDCCRYFFLSRSPDSQMEFDLDLAKKESSENPVYYIQYAHARISGILKTASLNQIEYQTGDVSLLQDPMELNLIKKMLAFPDLIEYMATELEPHHLPHYSQELANIFHLFYQNCRVISDDQDMTKARIKLVKATHIVLNRCLTLMGMDSPNTM